MMQPKMRLGRRFLLMCGLLGSILGAYFGWSLPDRPRPTPMQAQSSSGPQPVPPEPVSAASTPVGSSLAPSSGSPSAPSPPQPLASTPTPDASTLYEAIARQAATDLKATSDRCTVGEPSSCLLLGELEQQKGDRTKSEAYIQRAYGMWVKRCHDREPDACVGVAHLYQKRFIHREVPNAEEALLARSKELCRSHPGKVCVYLKP